MRAGKIIGEIFLFLLKAVLLVAIVTMLYRVGTYAYQFGHQLYDGQGVTSPPGRDVTVVVPEGASVSAVAEMLERNGLIHDRYVFLVQERLSKYRGQIMSGNFVLNTSWSGEDMLAVLSGHGSDLENGEET